ncbi:MAG: D-alanyl-D-alanine carboxypeptidase [Negativicutes bacterium]|nr:D-alanyl-D-alanine carboxypeptidase [Negativicutes bacterium]
MIRFCNRTLLAVCLASWLGLATALASVGPPAVAAESACLLSVSDGRLLWGKDENKIVYPASTTKIASLIVTLRQGDLVRLVTVGGEIRGVEGSSLGLREGQRLTIYDLLVGMMLASGNDAAEVLAASALPGGRTAFITAMNNLAETAGARWTSFTNPHGLPDPVGHFTTAYDMALITCYGYEHFPEFAAIVSKPQAVVCFDDGSRQTVVNTNKLLTSYRWANGVKTGHTEAAGDCLVAGGQKNGVQLVVVLYNDSQRWEDARALLDYGFALMGV